MLRCAKIGGLEPSRLRNVWKFSVDGPSTQVELAATNMKEKLQLAEPFLLRIDTSDFAYVKSICAREGMTAGPKSTPLSPRHDTSLRSLHAWLASGAFVFACQGGFTGKKAVLLYQTGVI